MSKKTVKEVVIYTIKPEFANEVNRVQEIVKECVESFDGFQKIESFQSTSDANTLMDFVSWDSIQQAKNAQADFEKLPKYNTLMSYLGEMKFADHFKN